jgi:hypothetical protein
MRDYYIHNYFEYFIRKMMKTKSYQITILKPFVSTCLRQFYEYTSLMAGKYKDEEETDHKDKSVPLILLPW